MTDYFSLRGYQVFGTTSPSKTAINRNNTKYYPLNLTDENAAQELIDQLQSEKIELKAVILTVGGFAMNNLSNAKMSDYEHMIKLNFFTAINVIKPVHKWMCEVGGGDIFMIGSRPLFEGSSREMNFYSLRKLLRLEKRFLSRLSGGTRGPCLLHWSARGLLLICYRGEVAAVLTGFLVM